MEVGITTKGESHKTSARDFPTPRNLGSTAATQVSEGNSGRVKALEQKVMDLKIVNRGKDYFIEQ